MAPYPTAPGSFKFGGGMHLIITDNSESQDGEINFRGIYIDSNAGFPLIWVEDATIEVNGGNIKGSNGNASFVNGAEAFYYNHQNAKVIINNGTVVGPIGKSDGVENPKLYINGGTIDGKIKIDPVYQEANVTLIERDDDDNIVKITVVAPEPEPGEPEPEPSTDVEIKDDNQDKNENNFPWAGVIIGGVAVTATVAAVAVACLAVRRK